MASMEMDPEVRDYILRYRESIMQKDAAGDLDTSFEAFLPGGSYYVAPPAEQAV